MVGGGRWAMGGRAADGSPRVWEVRGLGVSCPLFDRMKVMTIRVLCRQLVSREAAKVSGQRSAVSGQRSAVSGQASRGRESAGVSAVGGWRSTASMPYGRAMPQPACLRALAWERLQGGWPPHPRPLSPVSRGRGEESAFSGQASRGRESAGVSAAGVRRQPCCTPGHCRNRLAFPVARVCVLWQICHGPFSDAKGFRLFCWRSGAGLESQRGGQKIAAAWAFQKPRTPVGMWWECAVRRHIRSSKRRVF
jgi:hypothetical protein